MSNTSLNTLEYLLCVPCSILYLLEQNPNMFFDFFPFLITFCDITAPIPSRDASDSIQKVIAIKLQVFTLKYESKVQCGPFFYFCPFLFTFCDITAPIPSRDASDSIQKVIAIKLQVFTLKYESKVQCGPPVSMENLISS